MIAQNWESFQVSLPVSGLRQLLRTRLEGAFLEKAYPAYPMTHRFPLFLHPCHSSTWGCVCWCVGWDRGTFLGSLFTVRPTPIPRGTGFLARDQVSSMGHWALRRRKKTILKYPSACPLWEFRIMWLSRTYEINLPTSPGGRRRPFARALCMTGSSVLQWDTVGGQGQSEGHIKVFGG